MESDVKEEVKSECPWRVDEEDEGRYNFTDEKGLWQPKPEDILSMFDQLSKGGALTLQWACPGRRAPESEEEAVKREDTGMEVDNEDSREEAAREPEPCAFDFDDTQSETSVKTTPIRTLGGPGRTPRTEKRVARMDNIMDSLRKQQIQKYAEREARRAKGSPGRTPPARGGRLLKFGSPLAQNSKSLDGPEVKTSVPPVTAIVNTTENLAPQTQPSTVSTASSTSSVASATSTGTLSVNNAKNSQSLNVNSGDGNLSQTEKISDKDGAKDVTAPSSLADSESKVGVPVSTISVTSHPSSEETVPILPTNPITITTSITSTNQVPDQNRMSPIATSSSSITTTPVPTMPSVTTIPVTTSTPFSSSSSSLPPQPQTTVNTQISKPEVTPSCSISNLPVPQPQTETVTSVTMTATSTAVKNSAASEPLTSFSHSSQTPPPKPEPSVSESPSIQEENESTKESS